MTILAHPLVATPDIEEALVLPRVHTELGPLVIDQERLLGDGPRVRAGAEQVDRLDLGQEVEVQALRVMRGRDRRFEKERVCWVWLCVVLECRPCVFVRELLQLVVSLLVHYSPIAFVLSK